MESYSFHYYYKDCDLTSSSYYRVPRFLVKNPFFKELSSDAKLLYGLMQERVSLSLKNHWFDEQNRAYIYYSLDDVMEDLNIMLVLRA